MSEGTTLHKLLCAFRADFFGEYLYELAANHQPTPYIHCRLDSELLSVLKDALGIFYSVQEVTAHHWVVLGRNSHECRHLVITAVPNKLWIESACDFDVHMLAYNRASLYVRYPPHCESAFKQHPQGALAYLITRIQSRTFCLLPCCHSTSAEVISKAADLVRMGWVMDDALMPGNAPWKVMLLSAADVSATECAICNDDLKVGDVVITLKCSHTFHIDCANTKLSLNHLEHMTNRQHKSGIYAWLCTHQKSTCPMCRAQIGAHTRP